MRNIETPTTKSLAPPPPMPCRVCYRVTRTRFAGEPMCMDCVDMQIHEDQRSGSAPARSVSTGRMITLGIVSVTASVAWAIAINLGLGPRPHWTTAVHFCFQGAIMLEMGRGLWERRK